MLVQASGSVEVFNDEHPASTQPKTNITVAAVPAENLKKRYGGVLLIAGIAGCTVGLGSIPAIIFGTKALREMRENPANTKAKEWLKGYRAGGYKMGFFYVCISGALV